MTETGTSKFFGKTFQLVSDFKFFSKAFVLNSGYCPPDKGHSLETFFQVVR
jgi:hypothetical protein